MESEYLLRVAEEEEVPQSGQLRNIALRSPMLTVVESVSILDRFVYSSVH